MNKEFLKNISIKSSPLINKFFYYLKKQYQKIKNTDLYFKIGVIAFFSTSILFFLSPSDPEYGMPNPHPSRFVWTPIIPILTSFCFGSFLIGSISNRFSKDETLISSMLILFLIFFGAQLATSSPFGPDSWRFIQGAEQYRDFPNFLGGYHNFPGLYLFYTPLITIWPDKSLILATLITIITSMLWLGIIMRALSYSDKFEQWGVIASLVISGIFIARWTPVQFSAQLIGLLLIFYVFYEGMSEDGKVTKICYLIALILPTFHTFTPILFVFVLISECLIRSKIALQSTILALLTSLSFWLWNASVAGLQLGQRFGLSYQESLDFFPLSYKQYCLMIIFIITLYIPFFIYLSYFGERKVNIGGGGKGIKNISVLCGSLMVVPVLYWGEYSTGTSSSHSGFVTRLVVYSIVPLTWWGSLFIYYIINLIGEKIDSNISYKDSKLRLYTLVTICIIMASISSAGHINSLSRTWSLPENTDGCWDEAQEKGVAALFYSDGYILHSDKLIFPSSPDWYWNSLALDGHVRLQDETYWLDIIAIMETADLRENLDTYDRQELINDQYSLISEYKGACNIWVRNDLVESLDPNVFWDERRPNHNCISELQCLPIA